MVHRANIYGMSKVVLNNSLFKVQTKNMMVLTETLILWHLEEIKFLVKIQTG